jgi:predicted CopG family antitoxin
MENGITIKISRENYNYLTEIGKKKETFDQILAKLISKAEGVQEA